MLLNHTSAAKVINLRAKFLFALIATIAVPVPAFSHVKWFCAYDVTKSPSVLATVLTPNFFACLGAFILAIFLGFLADDWIVRRWPGLTSTGASWKEAEDKLIRLAMGAFFLCMWNTGGKILTPELYSNVAWISFVQFAIAVFLIWRRTCIISALGIGALYGLGIAEYGVFHMLDYVYFLGLAAYLALISFAPARMSQVRVPLLTGCLAFSLIWTAMEKMGYPQWSHQLMAKHGHMMMGLNFNLFIIIAAFVEFSLAFYLATGRGLLRFGVLALLMLFISAMPEFGHLDVVGHIPLVGILGVSLFRGSSRLQDGLRLSKHGIALNAAAISFVYVAALGTFLAMYYGVWWMEYG